MHPILRSVLAILAGAVVAEALIAVIELLGHRFFPPPAGLEVDDRETVVLLAWAVSALGGAWVAARFAGRSPVQHGLIVGGLLFAAGVANTLTIPHPAWFSIVALALFLPCGYLGARLAARPPHS